MNGVLDNNSALKGHTGTTIANEMNIVMNYDHGKGSIARIVAQQSSSLPLCYGCPLIGLNIFYSKEKNWVWHKASPPYYMLAYDPVQQQ